MLAVILALVVCGAIANPIDNVEAPRVIGGQDAYNGQFPYQVSLRHRNNGSHFCGGSIIGGYWILTTAQCVIHVLPSKIRVHVGTTSLANRGVPYNVIAIHSHANFNPKNYINDIAILELKDQISASSTVATIPLTSSVTPIGQRAILSGWGLTNYPSDALQYAYLKTITIKACQDLLPVRPIFDSHVCTHMPIGLGACTGNFGGPLVLNGVQHGISSWGNRCAKGDPDIFTSIQFYRNWIRAVSGV